MRLRPDELEAWRERAAQTVRPESRRMPWPPEDEARYERWLWSRAWFDLDTLEDYGRPKPWDADEVIATALEYRDMRPTENDSCCMRKFSGVMCDGSCRRWRSR